MRELDPGHIYKLHILDAVTHDSLPNLIFVKREGLKYPGNTSHHAGTNIQEVLRAILARLAYIDGQEPDDRNKIAAGHIGRVIFLLEQRAADRHSRKCPSPFESIFGHICHKCGHVGCTECPP